jgi:SAM-dependent methyltransferase
MTLRAARCIAVALAILATSPSSMAASNEVRSGGPYVATPQPVVDEMLNLARVGPEDFVVDLGSGDGRIVLTAARRFRARAAGFELDAQLVDLSKAEARRQGVDRLVRFYRQDVLQARISEATVVTLYLLPELMHILRGRIYSELRPGTRVVSHDFYFIDWIPDRKTTLELTEKYEKPGSWKSTLYLWIVPAKVEGRWNVVVSGPVEDSFSISLTQKFQQFEGDAIRGGERIALQGGKLDGNRIRFVLPETVAGRAAAREFLGTVNGNTISGEARSENGTASWRATRFSTAAPPPRQP